jgi:hypothetical protein
MTDKRGVATADSTLMDNSAVEPDVVRRADTHPERRDRSVDGDATGPDPLFRLAPRGKASTGQHFLEALRFSEGATGAVAMGRPRPAGTGRRGRAT